MTRIAILSDIHGNLPALEAVINDVQQVAPDRTIVDGDILNRGPLSLECLAAVRATGWAVIYGNHEDYAMKRRSGIFPADWAIPFFAPFQEVAEALSPEEAAYLGALPWSLTVEAPGLPGIHITHGSPRGLSDGLGHWLTEAELREICALVPDPVLVGAHTHRPYSRRIDNRWVLNTSAVGVPFDGDPRAQYLVLTGVNNQWEAELRRVPYDRQPLYDAYARNGADRHPILQVFQYEVETATFHFGPYTRFCNERGLLQNDPASVNAYRAATCDTEPGRSTRPTAPHPNGNNHGAG